MRYADGRLMKHPRAANFAWRCENGKYLYWFHNHGGRFIREHPRRRTIAYEDRNPVWLAGGVEADSPRGKIIRWSQPEIVLYDDDPIVRMSYPDLVEDGGKYYLTETQKDIARVHKIDATLLKGLWEQAEAKSISTADLLLQLPASGQTMPAMRRAPPLPQFIRRSSRGDYGADRLRTGVSLDLWVRLGSIQVGQALLDNRTPDGKGFLLRTADAGAVEIVMNDGRTENRWASDPGVLSAGPSTSYRRDSGQRTECDLIRDRRRVNDGGDSRQFGWGRFSSHFQSINGATTLRLNHVLSLRIYGRALRTSETIASYRKGM